MRTLLFLVLVVLVGEAALSVIPEEMNTIIDSKSLDYVGRFGNKRYYRENTGCTTYGEAIRRCRNQGMDLVTIETEAEMSYLQSVITTYYWTSGKMMENFMWVTGVPVYFPVLNEHPVCLRLHRNGPLYAVDCASTSPYEPLCQI